MSVLKDNQFSTSCGSIYNKVTGETIVHIEMKKYIGAGERLAG